MAQSNKVYLNPKFNDIIKTNMTLQQKNVMHINPLFAFQNRLLHQNSTVPKPRIYVNPNFITTKNNQKVGSMSMNNNVSDNSAIASTYQKVSSMPVNNNVSGNFTIKNNNTTNQVSAPLLTASRYSLVRHSNRKYGNEALVSITTKTPSKLPVKVTSTIKINKFKSVKLEDIKKSFENIKPNGSSFNSKGFLPRRNSKSNILENSAYTSQNIDNQKKNSNTKSRYRLVRCSNKNAVPQIVNMFLKKSAITTPIRSFKKELNILNNRSKYNLKNISFRKINVCLTPKQKAVYKIRDRFRIVKENTTLTCSSSNVKSRRLSLVSKKIHRSYSQAKINNSPAKFNKNNLPCPLFRKYGKCIRNINSNCKFLHDKKHVSICRKFLKGICHDKECFLSHDITSKKMPTCYYYLKGMCTKENCPYLHVKLNENTKICTDFTRGFCEKGENCLYRHINIHICPNSALKRKCSSERCLFPDKVFRNFKVQNSNKVRETGTQKFQEINIMNTNNLKEKTLNENSQDAISTKRSDQDYEVLDARYYKDAISDITDNEVCEIIKPTRVKLGTLPAFIQLKK